MSEIIGKDYYAQLPATPPDVSAVVRAMIEPLVIMMIKNKAGAVSMKTETTDGRKWEMFCQLVEIGAVSTVSAPIKGEDRYTRQVQAVHPERPYPFYIGIVSLAVMAGILVWLVFWGIWISS